MYNICMEVRNATRTVLLDQDNQVAVINVHKHGYYKIPGGGIESSEELIDAARREAKEESGCDSEIVAELGRIETDIPGWNMYDISDGFIARVVGEKGATEYEDWEKERGFDIEWYDSLDEAIQLIETNQVSDPNATKLQARDLEFLKRARNYLGNQK